MLCLGINQHVYIRSTYPAFLKLCTGTVKRWMSLHSEFAQPPAELVAYGTDYHRRRYQNLSILFMTFFITNICWFLLYSHFILKVDHLQNNSHTANRQMQAATVISALQRKTLRRLAVYIVMAATQFKVP